MSIRDKIVLAIGFPIITALWIAGWILIMMPTKKKAMKKHEGNKRILAQEKKVENEKAYNESAHQR